jgi:hypothetical protein
LLPKLRAEMTSSTVNMEAIFLLNVGTDIPC